MLHAAVIKLPTLDHVADEIKQFVGPNCMAAIHFLGTDHKFLEEIKFEPVVIDLGTVVHAFLRPVRCQVQAELGYECKLNQGVCALVFGGKWKEPHLSESDVLMLIDTLKGFVNALVPHLA